METGVLATEIPRVMQLSVKYCSEILTTVGKIMNQTKYNLLLF